MFSSQLQECDLTDECKRLGLCNDENRKTRLTMGAPRDLRHLSGLPAIIMGGGWAGDRDVESVRHCSSKPNLGEDVDA